MDLISASREATYSSIQTSQHIHHLPHASARMHASMHAFMRITGGRFQLSLFRLVKRKEIKEGPLLI